MKKKITLTILIVIAIFIAISFYAYKEFNRKNTPIHQLTTVADISTDSLLNHFIFKEKEANEIYLSKAVTITGLVSTVETTDSSIVIVIAANKGNARCYMQEKSLQKLPVIQPNKTIKVKGICTGFNADDLGLGADVIVTQCIIQ